MTDIFILTDLVDRQDLTGKQRESLVDLAARLWQDAGNGLTYDRIVQRTVDMSQSPDLPAGAVICTDAETLLTVMSGHLDRIDRYLATRESSGLPVNRVGRDVQETPALNPTVGGEQWYRGHIIRVDGGSMLFLESWMQPWRVGGSPFPEIYLMGEPDIGQVRDVAAALYDTDSQTAGEQ